MSTGDLEIMSLSDRLALLIEESKADEVRAVVEQFRPEDTAEALLSLSEEDIRQVLRWSTPETASEILESIDYDYWSDILGSMKPARLLRIIDEMPSDEAADVLTELDDEVREKVLARAKEKQLLENATRLLAYPDETAGAIMNADVVFFPQSLTVQTTSELIRQNIDLLEELSEIFITDEDHHLVGTLPLPRLITNAPDTVIEDIMSRDFIAVDVLMPEEEVVDVFRKYDLSTVPVVDGLFYLKGIITHDDIMDVMEELADEEAFKMAAMGDVEDQDSSLKTALARIPWLLTCLGGAMMAGSVIHLFNATLNQILLLASFLPAVMGMAGNTGIQTSTLIIRNLGSGPSLRSYFWRLVRQELLSALLIGLFFGLVLGGSAWLFFEASILLALLVGCSLTFSILSASILGVFLPFLLEKAKVDPAVASGPLITTLNDSMAAFIYLGMATTFMAYLD